MSVTTLSLEMHSLSELANHQAHGLVIGQEQTQ